MEQERTDEGTAKSDMQNTEEPITVPKQSGGYPENPSRPPIDTQSKETASSKRATVIIVAVLGVIALLLLACLFASFIGG